MININVTTEKLGLACQSLYMRSQCQSQTAVHALWFSIGALYDNWYCMRLCVCSTCS